MISPVKLDSSICVTTTVMEGGLEENGTRVVAEQSLGTEREQRVQVPAKRAAGASNHQTADVEPGQDGNVDCDSATQTDSATLTDGGNVAREREIEAHSSPSRPQVELRSSKRQRVAKQDASASATKAKPKSGKKSGAKEKSASPSAPFTLARAAQAAGVWNRAASKATLPKMPTMSSANDTTAEPTQRAPDDGKGHIVPFEGSVGDIILQDNTEHAEQLHQESGGDAVLAARGTEFAAENSKPPNPSQQPDSGANNSPYIPAETLKSLLQSCSKSGHLSVSDLLRAVQQSGHQGEVTVDEATHATLTSNVSTLDSIAVPAAAVQSTDNMQPPAPRPPKQAKSNKQDGDGAAAPAADAAPGDAGDSAAELPGLGVPTHARSLFLQLSDTGAVATDKSALERTATPIVHASGGPNGGTLVTPQVVPQSTGRRGGGALSLTATAPMPPYRQVMGHGVPVATSQRSKSDLLNNPEARGALWFPEKARSSKGNSKSRFPSSSKRAADHPRAGILTDRSIPGGADTNTASGQPTQSGATDTLGKAGQSATSAPQSKPAAPANSTPVNPITPEKVSLLLSLVAQLAVFADGGVRGRWCAALSKADCPGARALFRKALDLQMAGTSPAHLSPLLQTQSVMPASTLPALLAPEASGQPQWGDTAAVAAAPAADAPEATPAS